MALGLLFLFLVTLVGLSLLLITLLYTVRSEKSRNIIYYLLCIWSILVSIINVTSLPSNYYIERIFGVIFGFFVIISIIIKLKTPNNKKLYYSIVTASNLLSLFDIFFF